jgi:hypothetical protein
VIITAIYVPQALMVMQEAFNLQNTDRYRGGASVVPVQLTPR